MHDPNVSTKLSKVSRQERIVNELRARPSLRVLELASTMGVSTETIRRDLDDLGARGLINRTYGGAVRQFEPEPSIRERHQMLVPEREAIAAATSNLIEHGEILIIGGGATTTHVARRLAAEKHDLKVFTDSFAVATVLATNPTDDIVICPGKYNGMEGCVFGPETIDYVGRIYANHTIIGATGLTVDGPNEADMDIAANYRAMARRSPDLIVVSDHSKFDRPSISIYARWSNVTRLVTDAAPQGALHEALKMAEVDIVLAEASRF
jgi:DeoR/GlpR family transcriptional regulator of sugar metabolism